MAYDKNNFDPKAAAEARKKEMEEITTKLEKVEVIHQVKFYVRIFIP